MIVFMIVLQADELFWKFKDWEMKSTEQHDEIEGGDDIESNHHSTISISTHPQNLIIPSITSSFLSMKGLFESFNKWTSLCFMYLILSTFFAMSTIGIVSSGIGFDLYYTALSVSFIIYSGCILHFLIKLNGYSEDLPSILTPKLIQFPDYPTFRVLIGDVKYGFCPFGIFISPSVLFTDFLLLIVSIISIIIRVLTS